MQEAKTDDDACLLYNRIFVKYRCDLVFRSISSPVHKIVFVPQPIEFIVKLYPKNVNYQPVYRSRLQQSYFLKILV